MFWYGLNNYGKACWLDICPTDSRKSQKVIAKEAGCAASIHIYGRLSGRKTCGRKRCTCHRHNQSLKGIKLIYCL